MNITETEDITIKTKTAKTLTAWVRDPRARAGRLVRWSARSGWRCSCRRKACDHIAAVWTMTSRETR